MGAAAGADRPRCPRCRRRTAARAPARSTWACSPSPPTRPSSSPHPSSCVPPSGRAVLCNAVTSGYGAILMACRCAALFFACRCARRASWPSSSR
ncbi:hypothetical protein ACR6C2_01545 [Streptomyces sp. INA 01156]